MTAPVKLFGTKLEIAIKTTFSTLNGTIGIEDKDVIAVRQVEFISHSEFRLMFHHNVNAMVSDIMNTIKEGFGNVTPALSAAIKQAADEIVYYFTVDTAVDIRPNEWITFNNLRICLRNIK